MTTPVADVNGDGTLAHASALQEAYDMLHLAPPDEPPRRRTLQEAYDLQVAEDVDSTAAESPCMGLKRSAAQLAVADDNGSGMLHHGLKMLSCTIRRRMPGRRCRTCLTTEAKLPRACCRAAGWW